jgi:hypothetical protein
MKGNPKVYTRKRPAHPDEAHTRNKRWFKKKSRKSARKFYKNEDSKSFVGKVMTPKEFNQ